MYARPQFEGQVLSFGVSGKLLDNALIMYDRQTQSFWSQMLGEAIDGPLRGAKLEFLPSTLTTWEAWREAHPDTLALKTQEGGVSDHYDSYYESDRTGVAAEGRQDDRLPGKAMIAGLRIGEASKAYPWSQLRVDGLIMDQLDEVPILIVFDDASSTALAYERRLPDGRELNFVLEEASASSPAGGVLIDDLTDSRWSLWNGGAFEGDLAGTSLPRLPLVNAFWFGWKDYYPNTEIFGIE